MSSRDANPDSYIRTADSRYGMSSALTTNPARSWESMHCLPSVCSANSRARVAVSSAVMIECTISTRGSTGTGLKKCSPMTLCGCEVPAPSFMIGTDDVLEARNCASGSSLSSRMNNSRFSCSSSTIASIAASEPSTSSNDVAKAKRSSAAPRSSSDTLPDRIPRSNDFSIAARDFSARDGSTSTTVTSTPERAQTSAIPDPIKPPPITPTRMGVDRIGGYAASACTGTTQTQLRGLVDPGRSIRPAPRSTASCRATSQASFRSSTWCATGVSEP
jgi:hypothetical protein